MAESLKLYLVECRGMTSAVGGRPAHGRCYVIATDATAAWERVRLDLEERDIGTSFDRELATISLLGEDVPYPNCGHRLYVGGTND